MADNNWQLTPEQMEKARNCKSEEELLAFAQTEGVELTDEQLEAMSGGEWYNCSDEKTGCWNKTW